MPKKPSDGISDEEVLAMEISEDKRLREVGIDPDGDPIEIMKQVRLRMEKRRRRGSGRKKKSLSNRRVRTARRDFDNYDAPLSRCPRFRRKTVVNFGIELLRFRLRRGRQAPRREPETLSSSVYR